MFSQMRAAFIQARAEATPADPDVPYRPILRARDVLQFATIDGAAACGLDGAVGSVTPGKQADLVLVRADQVNTMPMTDPVGTVVAAADVSNVDTVIVRGAIRKQAGRLVGVDVARLRDLAAQSNEHLLAATAGV
jgi:cytosine/adenosine deaminase-related metal-dependent hydrolase